MKSGAVLYGEIRRLKEQAEEAFRDTYRLGVRPHAPHLAERYAEIERKNPGWHKRRAERARARLVGQPYGDRPERVELTTAPTPKPPSDMTDEELREAITAERRRLAASWRGLAKDSPWMRLLELEEDIRRLRAARRQRTASDR